MELITYFLVLALSFLGGSYCDTFYYFAYGSNMMAKRLKIQSPSAQFYNVAVLEGHRLDFNDFNKMWNGTVATIADDPDEKVEGALWVIDMKDMINLDNQEGVAQGDYFPKNVTVTTRDGKKILARTYQEPNSPPKRKQSEDIPYDRRPSNTYLQVIIFGALECNLSSDYIGFLVSFPTNGKYASDALRKRLGYPFGPKIEA